VESLTREIKMPQLIAKLNVHKAKRISPCSAPRGILATLFGKTEPTKPAEKAEFDFSWQLNILMHSRDGRCNPATMNINETNLGVVIQRFSDAYNKLMSLKEQGISDEYSVSISSYEPIISVTSKSATVTMTSGTRYIHKIYSAEDITKIVNELNGIKNKVADMTTILSETST